MTTNSNVAHLEVIVEIILYYKVFETLFFVLNFVIEKFTGIFI